MPDLPADGVVLVSGTGTGVGKTWVASELLRALRRAGRAVAARKPVQSFSPGDGPTDAELLAAATGEAAEEVCPPHRSYERPLAPPMAAEVLGRAPFTVAELAAELSWPAGAAVGLVEGAGGSRSPLASDGDTVTLSTLLRPRLVIVVSDAGLGALHGVRSSGPPFSPAPVTAFLNRFDARTEVHRLNRTWLAERDGFDVVTDIGELARRLT